MCCARNKHKGASYIKRKRSLYISFALVTVVCGLMSRSYHIPLPGFVAVYAGDTLWALMVFWCLCLWLGQWETWKLAGVALLVSFAVEFSQFYHAPWIDSIRDTTLGGLILGFGFRASDLLCYALGVLAGAFVDYTLLHRPAVGRSQNR